MHKVVVEVKVKELVNKQILVILLIINIMIITMIIIQRTRENQKGFVSLQFYNFPYFPSIFISELQTAVPNKKAYASTREFEENGKLLV